MRLSLEPASLAYFNQVIILFIFAFTNQHALGRQTTHSNFIALDMHKARNIDMVMFIQEVYLYILLYLATDSWFLLVMNYSNSASNNNKSTISL